MKMPPLKMRPLFALLILVSLLSSSFSVLPCRAQKPDAPPLFLEDFSRADAVTGRWEEVTNGGTMRVSEHRLTLLGNGGKGFPVLTTRTSPFPRSGDWTVSFGYRYTSIGNYGTDLSCDQAGGNKVIMIHQDISSQVLALNGTVIAHMPANTDWHVVSVAKVGSRIAAFVDGKESEAVEGGKKLDGGDLGTVPAAIRLGGSLQTNPWDWNDLQIQFVRVDAGLRPLTLGSLQPVAATSPLNAIMPESDQPRSLHKTNVPLDKTIGERESSASLQETLEWMTRKINNAAGYSWRDESMQMKYSHASFNGTDLTYTFEEVLPVEDNLSKVTISLDAIDENTVKYEARAATAEADEDFTIRFLPRTRMIAVSSERIAGNTLVKGGLVQFSSEDDARRFAAALRHAVHLSIQEKPKEPF